MVEARTALTRQWPVFTFAALAVAGLALVKWWPYGRRFASADLSFGRSLLDAPPLEYATRYVGLVWPAMVLGILLAAAVESLLPRSWLVSLLGRVSLRSSALGGLTALPAMMCSCCAAPVAVGLRRSGVSSGAALAFWIGSPTLNPAVLAFLLFTLPWQFAVLRLVAGVVLVFGVCHLVSRLAPGATATLPVAEGGPQRFLPAVTRYTLTLVPEWIALGVVLGFARAWLLPAIPATTSAEALPLALAAVGGTLFMIPTAGEIPIAQALLASGFGAGVVAALVVTLPAISLPSIAMVWRAFGARVLVPTAALVAAIGALTGTAAIALGL